MPHPRPAIIGLVGTTRRSSARTLGAPNQETRPSPLPTMRRHGPALRSPPTPGLRARRRRHPLPHLPSQRGQACAL